MEIKRKIMKKYRVLALVAIAFVVNGCANHEHVPQNVNTVRLPFVFQVESFNDLRQLESGSALAQAVDTREKYPLNSDLMMKKLIRSMNNRTLYNYENALLRIRLKDYAAVRDSNLQSVAFYADLTGVDKNGKVLASGLYSCFASKRLAVDFKGMFEKLTATDAPLHLESREEKLWQELYGECLADMARQFNADVVYLDRGGR